jgi:CBS domain containing-hemolysin-like protein
MSISLLRQAASAPWPRAARLASLLVAVLAAPAAHASFLSGDALATAANYMAIFVIVVVPIAVIVLFWLVHILPEKIAHKRHHPQKDAIQVLCLLSLVFGGLLWPLAWLWAYTKPVLHKMAYGTDKHEDYVPERVATPAAQAVHDEVAALRAELDRLAARSDTPRELESIRDRLAALEPRLADPAGEAR